jgi:L,D-transpeptidase ErfK/SrfK
MARCLHESPLSFRDEKPMTLTNRKIFHVQRSVCMPVILLAMIALQACSFGPLTRNEPLQLPRQPIDHVETHVFSVDPGDSVVGELATVPVKEDDTFSDLARHFGLGLQQVTDANPGIDPWIPEAGQKVLLPTQFILPDAPRKGLVINLATMRLFHFPGTKSSQVHTYPVGIGREGRASPMGTMTVDRKTPNPTWYVPESIRRDHAKKGDPLPAIVSPGPDNPLGEFAMYLSRPSYLIHGTNKPFSIGLRASNGCIRLYPEDIRVLFKDVKEKSQVRIVNQPYLVGQSGPKVYLEAHEPHEELDAKQVRAALNAKLKQIEKKQGIKLDWAKIDQVVKDARGLPVPVTEHSDSIADLSSHALALDHPGRLNGQPEPVRGDADAWYVRAIETKSQNDAEKMAAMLNHMGPRIPARAVDKGDMFEVLAGPYSDAKAAKLAAKQLKIEMEIAADVVAPARSQKLTLR